MGYMSRILDRLDSSLENSLNVLKIENKFGFDRIWFYSVTKLTRIKQL